MENSKPKGSGFLLVTGILMIIGGAISIIGDIFMGLLGVGTAVIGAGTEVAEVGAAIGGIFVIGAIIGIIGGVIELIAGILGCKNHKKPEKSKSCIVFGIIVLVLEIISLIIILVGSTANVGTIIITIICGIAVPVLYLIGAFLNKKSIQ